MTALLSRCRTGIGYGLGLAAAYSVCATASYVITAGAALERHGVTLGGVVLIYAAGGIAGGVLYGLLAPLTRWRVGGFLVGYVVSAPFFLGLILLMPQSDFDSGVTWLAVAVMPLAGAFLGFGRSA